MSVHLPKFEIDPDLPDGVYVGMSDEIYFAQRRLGSTDLTRLSSNCPEDWWAGSPHNPNREDPERDDEYLFGRALHAYVLEGQAVFLERFERSIYDSFATKVAQEWRAGIRAKGKQVLSKRSWRNVYQMGELIANHPQLRDVFRAGLSEVAVLFTIVLPSGRRIKMRAKFDKLLASMSIDLKTYGKHKQLISDEDTVIDIVVKMRYSLQRYIYDLAREHLCDLVRRDLVFGADPDEAGWLRDLSKLEAWGWCWIFYKKVSNISKSPSAPVVTPLMRPFQDATWLRGKEMAELAINNYIRLSDKWGFETPWARINKAIAPDDQKFIDLFLHPRNQDSAAIEEDDPINEH